MYESTVKLCYLRQIETNKQKKKKKQQLYLNYCPLTTDI